MMAASLFPDDFENAHINWTKLNLALLYAKDGIHGFIKDEVETWHTSIKQLIYGRRTPKRCNRCKSKEIIWNGRTWEFQKKCRFECGRWLQELIKFFPDSIDPNRVYWDNSYIPDWPFKPWECAKVFLPKGQQSSNNGPDKSDSQALMTLLKNCKHFEQKLSNDSIRLTVVISGIRNRLMHNPILQVKEDELKKGVQEIIKFLQDPSFQSVEECNNAISRIKKIYNADYKIVLKDENEAKLSYLNGQLCNIQMQMAERNEKHHLQFLQLEKEIQSINDLFETFGSSKKMQKNIKENINEALANVNNTISEHAVRISNLESGLGQIKDLVDNLIEKDPDIQEEKSANIFVESLKTSQGWNPKSDEAIKHLVESATEGKFLQCKLLLNEGVQMEMKHLPGVMFGKVSLEILRLVIEHMKDSHRWDSMCHDASVALEYCIGLNRTDLQDELTYNGINIECGINLDELSE